ncbi:hypothetical protein [Allokutzneria albata]|uniref:Transposase n=1 Tax=Allokutzneria albata TaxID=211114 RepID=A0A1H0CCQ7_ALLAB|nr:hypothetical protein [Allokutzneria albata]SDN55593.1 hypothetical protein SAMN04489726_7147 [Allokutzneria albata]
MFEVNHETLRNWVRTTERAEATGSPVSVSASEQEELRTTP